MAQKIFNLIRGVTLTVLLITLAIITWVLYSHFADRQFERLRMEMRLAVRGVELSGEEYLDGLEGEDFRATLISSDGDILYDSEVESGSMESHIEREEISEALESGYGESMRYSTTEGGIRFYTAERLSDGCVLRLAIRQEPVWSLFLTYSLPVTAVIAVTLIISFFLASGLSGQLTGRYNELDLDEPMTMADDPAFAEIRPLLKRIDDQHKQIRLNQEELEKTSLIRQEFTANASHELKTPLHVISGYAELLEDGVVQPETIPVFAGKIRTEAQRMTQLVEDIIDLTKLDTGAADMEREDTDLLRISQNAAESLATEAEEAGVSVEVRGEKAVVRGIPQILYVIVYNLLDNAIKYSLKDGLVTVEVRNLEDKVSLRVADQGIGIPKEQLDRIFERFYRVDKSRSKAVGGTGLGLSIVKHAARIHGADIDVTSREGEGTVFTVVFPK